MRYEPESLELIQTAARKAKELGHSYVGSIHLLLALLMHRSNAGQILRGIGLDPAITQDMAALLYGKGTACLPLPQGFSGGARQVLRGAAKEARNQKVSQIRPVHILIALARREKTQAAEVLYLSGIDTNDLFTRALENLQWENIQIYV